MTDEERLTDVERLNLNEDWRNAKIHSKREEIMRDLIIHTLEKLVEIEQQLKEKDTEIEKITKSAKLCAEQMVWQVEQCSDLERSLRAAEEQNKKLWEALKEVEYVDLNEFVFDHEFHYKICPECGCKQPDGHWNGCLIDHALGKEEK